MTLDDLELYKFEFSENFAGFRTFPTDQQLNEWRDQYCQRQRCKHVELEQFLACFRVSRVCQRQLGFLVLKDVRPTVNTVFIDKHCFSSVLMLRPLFGRVFPHLYTLLTVSLVLGLGSRPTCSQDICARFVVRASDTLTAQY